MASVNTPFGGMNLSDKMVGFAALAAVVGGGLIAYRLGWIGNYKVGTDQNINIVVDESKLADKTKVRYKNIAENLYREFNKTGITSFSLIKNMLSGLNTEELKQVVKDFGARNSTVIMTGMAFGDKMNLFTWMEKDIDSEANLNALKLIFQPTHLWTDPTYGSGKSAQGREVVEKKKRK